MAPTWSLQGLPGTPNMAISLGDPSFFDFRSSSLKMPKITPKMSPRGPLGAPRGPQNGSKRDADIDGDWPFFGFYVPRALKTDFDPIWGPSWAQLGAILGPLGAILGLLGPSGALLGPS